MSRNTVTLNDPDAAIDLGGIAKGFIADKMKAYLNENGITSGIINLGGNVLIIGPKRTVLTTGSASKAILGYRNRTCHRIHPGWYRSQLRRL